MKGTNKKIRRKIDKIFVIAITLVIAVLLTVCVLKINTKVFRTQIRLASIGFDIRYYNQLYIKTNDATRMAEALFSERINLAHSKDPVVAFAARHGFSLTLFLGSMLIYLGILFLWYKGLQQRRKILKYVKVLLYCSSECISECIIDFIIWSFTKMIKLFISFSDLFLDGALTISFWKMKLKHQHKKIRKARNKCRRHRTSVKRKNVR